MIRYVSRGLTFGELWFGEREQHPLPDVLIRRHDSSPEPGAETTRIHSFVTDLTLDEDRIFATFGKHCQTEIRRAEREPGLSVDPVHIARSRGEIDRFLAFHRQFASDRGLRPAEPQLIDAMVKEGRFLLSSASVGDTDVVWHSYIATQGRIARGLQTASFAHNADSKGRRLVSRANRLLHWVDMTALKRAGFAAMDWGGRFADETVPHHKSINDFKRDFGATPIEYYENWQPISLRGRVYARLRAFKRLVNSSLAVFQTPDDGKQVVE
jgi:hypothetical protein